MANGTYAAMIEAIDASVGTLVKGLKARGRRRAKGANVDQWTRPR
jgi:hypothetical protein